MQAARPVRRRNEKRAPESRAPVSKSRPSGAPRSTWSGTGTSKLRGVPTGAVSTLLRSVELRGTESCGRLGTDISISASAAWIASRRSAQVLSSPASPATSAIASALSSPGLGLADARATARCGAPEFLRARLVGLAPASSAGEARHVQEGLWRLARLERGDDARQVPMQQADVEHGGDSGGVRGAAHRCGWSVADCRQARRGHSLADPLKPRSDVIDYHYFRCPASGAFTSCPPCSRTLRTARARLC